MNLENVHYNAFISYRHCEKDKFVAENLHRILEAFSLPAGIRKDHPELPKKIERVFRDQEELPLAANLADPITEALSNSDNLIVICTPRLKESLWCQKEIETFIEMHGRSHVFAVLAEGEPEDSFPYQLLVDDAGYPIEPLGADVRGETHQQILKKMKTEVLRLIAPMFELNYDDLRQRHKEQRTRRLFAIGAAAMAVVLAFGIYSSVMALKIKRQADDIAAQNVKITKQSEEIESQNEEIKKQAHDIALKYAVSVAEDSKKVVSRCERPAAVKMLREVLPDDKSDELVPYTTECERALTDSLGIYEVGNTFYPDEYYESDEPVIYEGITEDGKYLVLLDNTGILKIFDLNTQDEILSKETYPYNTSNAAAISGHKVFFENLDGNLGVIDIDSGTEKEIFGNVSSLYKIKNHNYIAASIWDGVAVIDASSDSVVMEIECRKDADGNSEYMNKIAMSDDEKYIFAAFLTYVHGLDTVGRFAVYDMESSLVVSEFELEDDSSVSAICQNGDIVYFSAAKNVNAMDVVSTLYAYDYVNNSLVYKEKQSNHKFEDMDFVDKGENKYIFARDENGPYTFDAEDGRILYSENCSSGVVMGLTIGDGGHEMLILEDGNIMLYMVENGYLFENNYFRYPYSEEVHDAQFVKGMFTFHSFNSKRVGVFRTRRNESMETFDSKPEYTELTFSEPELKISSKNLTLKAVGLGAELLDSDGNCIADISDCVGYDEAGDKLIYCISGDYRALPIYSYEEILKAADDYIAECGG